jgi:hypothetical protein
MKPVQAMVVQIVELAGIALGVAQAVDAVAHDEAHRARIVIGPDGLRAVLVLDRQEAACDLVERLVPGNPLELARSLGPDSAQGMQQPVGMVDALGIARDLGADHPIRIALALAAAYPPDAAPIDDFDLQRTGGGAVMGANGWQMGDAGKLGHNCLLEHCAKKWVPVFRVSNALNSRNRAEPSECDVIFEVQSRRNGSPTPSPFPSAPPVQQMRGCQPAVNTNESS